MKTILTILGLILSFSIYSQNHPLLSGVESFELWEKSEGGALPKFWDGFNREIVIGGFPVGVVTTVYQDSTNAYDGNSAVILRSQSIMGGAAVPGILSTGVLNIDFVAQTGEISGGMAYSLKPDFFSGFFKCFPATNDTAIISVVFKKQGIEVGSGVIFFDDTTSAWSPFSIPINYSSSLNPDTVLIFIATSTNKSNVPLGSQLHIDKVGFDFASSVPSISGYQATHVYPNPCTDFLQIDCGLQAEVSLAIFDAYGQEILYLSDYQMNSKIDVKDFKAGIYIVRFFCDHKLISLKFIKQ